MRHGMLSMSTLLLSLQSHDREINKTTISTRGSMLITKSQAKKIVRKKIISKLHDNMFWFLEEWDEQADEEDCKYTDEDQNMILHYANVFAQRAIKAMNVKSKAKK